MKKLILFFLTILLLIFTVGCGKTENPATLRVGMDLKYYPFTGTDESGNPAGVEVDIAKALGDYIGREVTIVNTEFAMLIPALQSGDIDVVIGSMSISDEREKAVDFSKPYMYNKIVAILNKAFAEQKGITDATPIDEFFSIEETKFVGLTGSIAVSIPQSYGHEVTGVTTSAAAEREVTSGSADALVGSYMLYGMHATNPKTTVMYKNAIEVSGIGMAVKEGNIKLLDELNSFIDNMDSLGVNDELRKTWDVEIGKKLFDDTMTLDYYLKK